MTLWAATTDGAKPKNLTTAEKLTVTGKTAETLGTQGSGRAAHPGWVLAAGDAKTGNGNTNAQAEVLVCVGSMS